MSPEFATLEKQQTNQQSVDIGKLQDEIKLLKLKLGEERAKQCSSLSSFLMTHDQEIFTRIENIIEYYRRGQEGG